MTRFMKLATMPIEDVAKLLLKFGNDDIYTQTKYCTKGCPKREECEISDRCINLVSDEEILIWWLNQEEENYE